MSNWVDVDAAIAIEPGTYRVADLDDAQVLVFNVEGAFFAIEDLCTHDMSPLSGGDFCGNEITCPRHGAQFDVKTGEALTPPAYEDVPTFPVRVENGVVQVRDARFD